MISAAPCWRACRASHHGNGCRHVLYSRMSRGRMPVAAVNALTGCQGPGMPSSRTPIRMPEPALSAASACCWCERPGAAEAAGGALTAGEVTKRARQALAASGMMTAMSFTSAPHAANCPFILDDGSSHLDPVLAGDPALAEAGEQAVDPDRPQAP